MRVGGEKATYQIPTYEALKGVLSSVYWKPTIIWFIDSVRIMNSIQTEVKGIRPIKYDGGNDLAYYTYLKNVRYQIRAHFEWNMNRPELEYDRDENKHHNVAKRMIERGGRRDIFLGTRECQAYVEACSFGTGKGSYDDISELGFGLMYHGITYPDENSDFGNAGKGNMIVNFWYPLMKRGVINFIKPYECPMHKKLHEISIKKFGIEEGNFTETNELGD